MTEQTAFLRKPISAIIRSNKCQLVTTGHVAHALRRTPRTVRYWQEMCLLPKPPFVLNSHSIRSRRWLYPADFVEALAEIAESGLIGDRIDQQNVAIVEHMIDDAEAEFITPLLGEGVTGPVVLELVRRG